MSNRAGIYCLKNKRNSKRYIGSSVHIEDRLMEHLNQLENHVHSNKMLQEAFDYDGLEFCILEYVDDQNNRGMLLDCEQKWIDFYNTTNSRYGYNKINASSTLGVFRSFNRGSIRKSKSRWFMALDAALRSNRKTRCVWNIFKAFFR